MSANQLEALHREHAAWHSENAFWRDEVRGWQYAVYRAKGAVTDLRRNFDAYESELATYAATMLNYDEEIRAHEHELTVHQLNSRPCDPPLDCGERHSLGREHHACQDKCHEAFKKRHYRIMRHLRGLLRALAERDGHPIASRAPWLQAMPAGPIE